MVEIVPQMILISEHHIPLRDICNHARNAFKIGTDLIGYVTRKSILLPANSKCIEADLARAQSDQSFFYLDRSFLFFFYTYEKILSHIPLPTRWNVPYVSSMSAKSVPNLSTGQATRSVADRR